jgi:TfoX/Sxy family transcriptional regulator of competence genes
MQWQKSPAELIELFHEALPTDPLVERRKMFGYPCAIVNGHMFTSLHGDSVIVRLPEARRDQLLAAGGGQFAPMPDRPMTEFFVLPESIVREPTRLREWVELAFVSAAALPPKSPAPRAKSKKKSA